MNRFLILFILLFVTACGGQTKEELVQEGDRLQGSGNYRGAIVLYKNALEKDVNYLDARFGLANAYLKSGNFDRAEKEFQKILLQSPSEADILLKLATIYIQQNKPEKALLELDKYHSENHETVESLVLYGRAHGASGDLDSAENLFNRALSLDARAIDPRFNLAKVYLQKKNPDKAKSYLRELIGIKADEIPAYYLLAGIETRQGNLESALDTYRDLLAVDEKQLQALYMSGILQMDLGEMDAAHVTVDKLSRLFPDRAEGSRLKGMLFYRQEKFEEARVTLENSIQAEPHILSFFFLGLSYYGLNQYELALNQFQKALDLSPEFERARVLVAMTLLKQQRLDDAIMEIGKVLRGNPNNAYAHNILGSAYLAKGEYDQGMEELELATELDPHLADAHMKRGIFHLAQGEGAQGEADLIKAVEAAPEVMNSRLMLVTHYLRRENYSAAIETLNEGMNGTKADALLNNYLAAAYFSQKKTDKALAALEKAKQINPAYLTPYFNLASYYASESDYAGATAEYEQVLAIDDKNIRALLGLAALYNVQGRQEALDSVYRRIETTGSERGFVAAAQYQLKQQNPDEAMAIVDRGLTGYQNSKALLELKGALHMRRKEFAAAEAAYIKLSGVAPEAGNSLLIRLYLAGGQTEKAQQLVDGLLQSDADQDYPYLLASGLLTARKDFAAAGAVLEKGIATVKQPLRLQMQLGRLFEQQGDATKAEQIYRRVLAADPRFAPAHTALGFIKERNGLKREALELYKKAVVSDRRNVPALNNLAYLLADNFGAEKEALNYAMSAYRLQSNDPRVMDTLGYILVKNQRAGDALNLLEKAHQLLPQVGEVTLHLAMAKAQLGEKKAAAALLQPLADGNDDTLVKQVNALLKAL